MLADWAAVKSLLTSRNLPAQYTTVGSNYWIKAIDYAFELECLLPVDSTNTDTADFIANFQANANLAPTRDVRTQFEQTQYLLQMSNIQALNVAPGTSTTVTLQIPGTFNGTSPPANGRYIDEGEAWFYPGSDGDYVTTISITDNDNLLGGGAGYIIGTYTDSQVAIGNRGWAIHPVFPTEVSTLGWYGFIPSGMYLNITVTRSSTASVNGNFYCNLKWGMAT